MAQELLPLHEEAVVEGLVVGTLAPVRAEIDRDRGHRGSTPGAASARAAGSCSLRKPTTALPCVPSIWNSTSSSRLTRTSHDELICATIPPSSWKIPYAASSAVASIRAAALVDALRDVDRAERRHAAHRRDQVLQHVAPVAEHVDHDPAAVLDTVVPRRPLRRGPPRAFEHPVAELAAHATGCARRSRCRRAAAASGIRAGTACRARCRSSRRARARAARCAALRRASARAASRSRRACRRAIAFSSSPGRAAVVAASKKISHCGSAIAASRSVVQRAMPCSRARRFELLGVAAGQHRLGPDHRAVVEAHAAARADRDDRADEVLVHPHAAGDAVHDDADGATRHCLRLLRVG